jgi:hypothetical protein
MKVKARMHSNLEHLTKIKTKLSSKKILMETIKKQFSLQIFLKWIKTYKIARKNNNKKFKILLIQIIMIKIFGNQERTTKLKFQHINCFRLRKRRIRWYQKSK